MPVTGVRPAESPYHVWPCNPGADVRVLRHVCGVVVADKPVVQSWREREKHHHRQGDADGYPAAGHTGEGRGRSPYLSQDAMLAGADAGGKLAVKSVKIAVCCFTKGRYSFHNAIQMRKPQ